MQFQVAVSPWGCKTPEFPEDVTLNEILCKSTENSSQVRQLITKLKKPQVRADA